MLGTCSRTNFRPIPDAESLPFYPGFNDTRLANPCLFKASRVSLYSSIFCHFDAMGDA